VCPFPAALAVARGRPFCESMVGLTLEAAGSCPGAQGPSPMPYRGEKLPIGNIDSP
jgi:hypothetical protein